MHFHERHHMEEKMSPLLFLKRVPDANVSLDAYKYLKYKTPSSNALNTQ